MRIGDTVRRAPLANAAFVRDLLGKLERAGFESVPRWLGVDEQGRETFTYLEGKVVLRLGHVADTMLRAAAQLIRRYHDATAPFFESGRVACHNDLSPLNFVFRDGLPSAIFDFDSAAEGEPILDLGYAAWTWLNVETPGRHTVDEQLRRLRLFATAYDPQIGLDALIEAMLHRQQQVIERDNESPRMRDVVKPWARRSQLATVQLRDRLLQLQQAQP